MGLTNLTNRFSRCENHRRLTNLTNRRFIVPVTASQTPSKPSAQPVQVNLYEAKTQLSALVDRAAKGEEIVIAKAGKPMAKLTPLAAEEEGLKPLRKFGQNLLGITFLSDDWEKDIPLSYFQDEGKENPFGDEPVASESK
jgi:prevent-host-death family protein